MSTRTTRDEFRFLASDAARVGRTAPLPRVERVWADVSDGRRISGLSFTPDESPRLVVLHGAGLNAHSYDPTLLALDVPALALDLPGHGRSDWREDGDYRPDHLATDIELALTTLAPDASQPITLAGHSLGGLAGSLVAESLQRHGPDRLSRLVLIDVTPGLVMKGTPRSVTDFIQGQRDYGSIDEIVDRAIGFGIGSDRAALSRGVELNTRYRPDGRLEWTHHLAHLETDSMGGGSDPRPYAPIWSVLEHLETPITQIRAEAGMVQDVLTSEWRERLPSSEVVTIAGPHNLHEAAPVELAAVIRSRL